MITNAKDLGIFPESSGVVRQGSIVINSPKAMSKTRRVSDSIRPQINLFLKTPPEPVWSDSSGGGTFDSD